MRWHGILHGEGLLSALGARRSEMTPAESLLWRELKGRKLLGCAFARQHPVDRYVVAFYCGAPAVAIEVDGKERASPRPRSDHQARDVRLRLLGITVLRFTDEEVMHDLDGVLCRIRQSIRYLLSGQDVRGA